MLKIIGHIITDKGKQSVNDFYEKISTYISLDNLSSFLGAILKQNKIPTFLQGYFKYMKILSYARQEALS